MLRPACGPAAQRARGVSLPRLLIVLALGLPLALAALLAWALGTAAGGAWLLAQAGLQVSAPRGTLAGGAFEAARVHWSDGRSRLVIEDLSWRDLVWRWAPPGAWIGVDLVEARAQRVEWQGGAPSTGERAPAPTRLRVPLHARLVDLRVEALQLDALPPVEALRLDAEVGADGGRVHRVPRLALRVDGMPLRAHAEIGTEGDLPLRLQLDAQSAPGRAPWSGQLSVEGPLQRLQASARIDSRDPPATLDARATLAPFAAWPLLALQLEARDFDLASLSAQAPATRLSGRADVRSSALDAPIEADIEIVNALPGRWDRARLPLQRLQLTLRGRADARDTLELLRLDARLGHDRGGAGRVSGSGRWQRDSLRLELRADALRPEALDARAPAMTIDGPLALSARGLPSPDPAAARDATAIVAELTARLGGRFGARPDAPPLRVDADATLRSHGGALELTVPRLDADAGGAQLRLDARAARGAAGAWSLTTRGRIDRFDPRPWLAGVETPAWPQGPHRLDAQWDADLRLAAGAAPHAVRGRARVDIGEASTVAALPLAGRLDWTRADGAAPQGSADLRLAGNTLALRGDASTGGRWQAQLDAPQLARLAPLAGAFPAAARWLPSAGTLTGSARAEGTWPALRTEGELRIAALRSQALGIERATLQWALAADALTRRDAPLRLTVDADGLAVGAQRVQRLRAQVDGSAAAHRFEVDAASPLRPPAWTDAWLPSGAAATGTRLRMAGDGGIEPSADGYRWRGRVADARAVPHDARDEPLAVDWLRARALALAVDLGPSGAPHAARAEPGQLQLLDATLRWRQLQWRAGPGGRPTLDVDAEVDPAAVAPWLQRLQPDFGWDGDLRLGATLRLRVAERVDADLVVERRGGDLALVEAGNRQPFGLTDLRFALAAHDGVWHFTQALAGAQVGVLAGAQSLRPGPAAAWPAPGTPLEGVVELTVAHVGVWAPWLPPGWRLGGSLHSSATLGGRFGAPEYTGTLTGSGLAVRHVLHGVDVRDGELALTLAGAQARIERFRFRGGDGTLELRGGATFGATPRAQLQLLADQMQVLGRVDRRLVVSGRADATLDAQAIRVEGRLGVDRGLFDFSRADAPSLDGDVTVVRRGESPPEPAAARERAAQRTVDVRLAIDLGRALRLRGRGLETTLRGQLALTTPGGRPALTGTVLAEDGGYNAYGQRLRIDRGEVVFTGAVDNPRLDILAVRPNLDVEVGVEIGGTAQSPRVRLFSDPPMPDVDKLSWLLLGREPDGLGRADAALLQSAALALLAGEDGGVNVLQRLGIDELSVAQTEDGDVRDTVVTIGKQLSRRWYVAYERGVNATAGSWQLIYRAARRLTIRAQTGDDTALDVIWTWRWD